MKKQAKMRFVVIVIMSLFCCSRLSSAELYSEFDARAYAQSRAYSYVANMLNGFLPHFTPERALSLAKVVVDESEKANFDPLFVMAVIEGESNFDYEVTSPTGARGLMQVLPSTWKWQCDRAKLGKLDQYNPEHNVLVGIKYLQYLGETFKRPESILLAYNQGPSAATSVLSRRGPATEEGQRYGPTIMGKYRRLLAEAGLNPRYANIYFRWAERTLLLDGQWYCNGDARLISSGVRCE